MAQLIVCIIARYDISDEQITYIKLATRREGVQMILIYRHIYSIDQRQK